MPQTWIRIRRHWQNLGIKPILEGLRQQNAASMILERRKPVAGEGFSAGDSQLNSGGRGTQLWMALISEASPIDVEGAWAFK